MVAFLLLFALLTQGIPVRPSEGGTVTGTVRTPDGKPAVGVRVAARSRPDSLDDAIEGAAMAGIAETDGSGRYRLENVPPGRYVISAGRVDLPTFYPGTLDLASGTVVPIAPGSTTTGIDFTLAEISFAQAGTSSQPPGFTIPLQIRVEGGRKLPVFADGDFPMLALIRTDDGARTTALLDSPSVTVQLPIRPSEYRAVLENLPAGYSLKAMAFGAADITTSTLKISASDLPLSGSTLYTTLGANLIIRGTNVLNLLSPSGMVANGAASRNTLTIVLAASAPPPAPPGKSVSGRVPVAGARSIYLSDIPGTLYSDGTFEFRAVPPGRHIILASSADSYGASLIVGERDMEGIELQPVPLAPRRPATAQVQSTPTTGIVMPLPTLRVRLISSATQKPLSGLLNLIGASMQIAYPLSADGRAEIPLLPGGYDLQVSVFDHFTVNHGVDIEDKDLEVELIARRAY